MCGIIGCIGKVIDGNKFDLAMESLAHRGPDSCGKLSGYGDVKFTVGHQRLSIVDLSQGSDQPFKSACNNYVLVFNGEIYNYQQLRNELQRDGIKFSTRGDTEVLMNGLRFYGINFLKRINGMWAFCFIDIKNKRTILARDRYGEKPLYYAVRGEYLYFSSELKGILELGVPLIPSDDMENIYSDPFGYESTGKTVLQGVSQVKPGHFLEFSQTYKKEVQWWNTLDNLMELSGDFDTQSEEFRSLIDNSIGLRSNFEVPFATALSGGLDSSCLAYALKANAQTTDRYKRAFFTSFPGDALDESKYANYVANDLKLDLQVITPSPSSSNLVQIIRGTEDPYITYPLPPITLYSEMSNMGYKVSFDGHGVDELLSGYGDIRLAMSDASIWDLKSLLTASNGTKGIADESIHAKDLLYFLLSKLKKATFYRTKKRYAVESSYENHPAYKSMDELTKQTYKLFHLNVLPTLLRNFDRYSMMSGIEIRMPFLDFRIVNYCFSLGWKSKVRGGLSKALLRNAFKGEVPDFIRCRPLKGAWNTPMGAWLPELIDRELISKIRGSEMKSQTKELIELMFTGKQLTNDQADRVWGEMLPILWDTHYFNRN